MKKLLLIVGACASMAAGCEDDGGGLDALTTAGPMSGAVDPTEVLVGGSTGGTTGTTGTTTPGTSGGSGTSDADAGLPDLPGLTDPEPVDPCGTDIDAVGGEVRPDLGVVPDGGAFSGDADTLAGMGEYQVASEAVSVPIKGGTENFLGFDVTIEDGTLSGTAFLPSDDGSSPATGEFPLIVILPGFQTSYAMYEHYSTHFASHGFAVLGVDTRSDALAASHSAEAWEVMQSIDFALSAGSPFAGHVDETKIAVAGHSKGGKLSFFTAAADHRVDQVIAWDPQNAGGPPCFVDAVGCNAQPVAPNCNGSMLDPGSITTDGVGIVHEMRAASLTFGQDQDTNVTPDAHHHAVHFYRGAPSPAAFIDVADGHLAWLAAPLGNDTINRITQVTGLATLLTAFKGVTGLDMYLPGGGFAAGEDIVKSVHTK